MNDHELHHRFLHHPPKGNDTVQRHEHVRVACARLAETINAVCNDSREKALAITKLEEAMMWTNAAIARQGDPIDEMEAAL